MDTESKRRVEVRLIVVTVVLLDSPEFIETVKQQRRTTVAEIVASEVVSSLESVPYIEFAVATQL